MESEALEKGVLNESNEEKEKIQEANRNETVKKVGVALQMYDRTHRTRGIFVIIFLVQLIGLALDIAGQNLFSTISFIVVIIIVMYHSKHENLFVINLREKYGI